MPLFTPVGGGGIGKAAITATAGSPTVDTTSRSGKTIYKFLSGTGSVTVGTAGTIEVLVVAGGGGSGDNGCASGGGGGVIYKTSYYVPVGTYNIIVGAGGAGAHYTEGDSYDGENSSFGDLFAIGGGGGSRRLRAEPANVKGHRGGSGGGGAYDGPGGAGVVGQGGNGASGYYGGGYVSGSGGGAGGNAGTSPDGYTPGTPGPGIVSTITGTSVEYGKGAAASYGGTLGAANTGNAGGGRSPSTNPELCAGGSGIVVVVTG